MNNSELRGVETAIQRRFGCRATLNRTPFMTTPQLGRCTSWDFSEGDQYKLKSRFGLPSVADTSIVMTQGGDFYVVAITDNDVIVKRVVNLLR